MSEAMYKFISIEEWDATEEVADSEGNVTTKYACKERVENPDARVSVNEVVISCNDDSGTHTRDEALAHIESTWPKEEVEGV